MCAGLILYAFADIVIITYYTRKLTGISLLSQIKVLLPVVLLSFSMGGLVYLTTLFIDNAWIQILLGMLVGICYYVVFSYCFGMNEIKTLTSMVKHFK